MRNAINRLLGVLFYPFGGLEYYHKDLLQEYNRILYDNRDSIDGKELREYRNRIYSDIYSNIKKYCDVHSYDEICLLYDKYYLNCLNVNNKYKESKSTELYLHYLTATAKAFISQRDGKIVYKYWENEGDRALLGGFTGDEKVLLFHAFTKRIPIDMFVMQYMITTNKYENDKLYFLENYYEQINIADLQLDQILEHGVAENHLHLGTATSYYYLWQLVMQSPILHGYAFYAFCSYISDIQKRTHDYRIHEYLLLSGFIRLLVSIFLKEKLSEKENTPFLKYVSEYKNTICEVVQACLKGDTLENVLQNNNIDINKIDETIGFFKLLWESVIESANLVTDEEQGYDCIRSIFSVPKKIHTTGENILLFYSLQYIQSNGKEDIAFHQLFWQYIRIKSMFFQLWVQGSTTRGLDYFEKFYSTNGIASNMSNNYWKNIIRAQFANKYLKKIEFRTTLNNEYSKTKLWIIEFFKAYLSIVHENYCKKDDKTKKYIVVKEFPQAAIVYHLIKEKDYSEPEKCWYEYMENKESIYPTSINENLLDYYNIQKKYIGQVDILKKIRNECPELTKYLVGLDAASSENNTPVWVFAPVYERARDSQDERLIAYGLKSEYDRVQSLRFTFHAGEDFRHILSGLRRINEVIEYCKFHAGDRIGHGVALGLDPVTWKNMNPMVVLPRIEILDNLLWVYKVFSHELYSTSNIQFYIEKEIFYHAKKIYKNTEGITIPLLLEAYEQQFLVADDGLENCYIYEKNMAFTEPNRRTRNLFCERLSNENSNYWTAKKLYASRHCRKYLVKMMEPVYYKVTEQEIDIACEVQKIIRKQVSKLGIVIEVNPSSNAAITEADTLFKNQAYALNGLVNNNDNVLVCINTDNPSSCATNISNELAYIYYGMIANGSSKEEALLWIDKIRKNGIESSFIHNHRSKEDILEELELIAKELGIEF